MISLGTTFWILVAFFGLIGALRGWTKEVIATSGLILSLFALNQFGTLLFGMLGSGGDAAAEAVSPERRQFYILAAIHLAFAFFSYQGPVVAGRRIGERLRVRDNFQNILLGFIVGSMNGYLIIGSLWSFLEYRLIAATEWKRLDPGIPYPFDVATIIRPALDTDLYELLGNMPVPILAPWLPYLVVIVFLFVIVVLI
ncbi:MAG: hypothetical protein DWQ04_02080 [Chloroflexi bacterium]|nr:MAG: hypothetical protein DWQ04_02080 [Chloroflexota bacterium]